MSSLQTTIRDLRRRKARERRGLALAEGVRLVEEALAAGVPVRGAVVSPALEATSRGQTLKSMLTERGIRLVEVGVGELDQLADTEQPQGIVAVIEPREWSLAEVAVAPGSVVLVLDGVQDPGNAGAILRAAEAFGATGVMFLKGTASPFNPKTLRASAGSLFRVPFVHSIDAELARAAFKQNKLDVYAGVPFTAQNHVKSLAGVDFTRKCAVIIGSEGQGVSQKLHAGAIDLAVPTVGVESLNAAMAASVILYEARRQRSLKP